MASHSIEQVKKMNGLMLKYSNDIVGIDKQEIITFFEVKKIPYIRKYIEFLSQFGGNQSSLFQTYGFNCTFQEIKEIYLENALYDPVPPEGYCIIANQEVEDWFMIENSTGRIFNSGEKYDENGKSLDAELAFETIDDFLWMQLFATYQKEFINNYASKKVNNINEYVSYYLKGHELLHLPYLNNTIYYLKDNELYFYQQGTNIIHINTLIKEFFEQLYL